MTQQKLESPSIKPGELDPVPDIYMDPTGQGIIKRTVSGKFGTNVSRLVRPPIDQKFTTSGDVKIFHGLGKVHEVFGRAQAIDGGLWEPLNNDVLSELYMYSYTYGYITKVDESYVYLTINANCRVQLFFTDFSL